MTTVPMSPRARASDVDGEVISIIIFSRNAAPLMPPVSIPLHTVVASTAPLAPIATGPTTRLRPLASDPTSASAFIAPIIGLRVITTAITLPAIICTPAIVMTVLVHLLPHVELAGGSVALSTSGGGDGGGRGVLDERAVASTTKVPVSVTTVRVPFLTTSFVDHVPSPNLLAMLVDDNHAVMDDGRISSLLPTSTDVTSHTNSRGRRSRLSGLPLRAHRIDDYSPLPPSAVESGAARRSGGRPTAISVLLTVTASPRPGPASLLPPSGRPQPGRLRHGGGRAGSALRAHQECISTAVNCSMDLIRGPAHACRLTKYATPAALRTSATAARSSIDAAHTGKLVTGNSKRITALRNDDQARRQSINEARNNPQGAPAPVGRAIPAARVGIVANVMGTAVCVGRSMVPRLRGAPGPMPVAQRG